MEKTLYIWAEHSSNIRAEHSSLSSQKHNKAHPSSPFREYVLARVFHFAPSINILYFQAVANARLVGAQIAYLIQILNDATGVSTKSVHIIGHSLGAHIAGYTGKRLARKNVTLGRITGMDSDIVLSVIYSNVDCKLEINNTLSVFCPCTQCQTSN